MKKRVLIVGCGFPQLSLIRTARSLGLSVVGIDFNEQAVGVPYCNDFLKLSTHDVEAILDIVKLREIRAITSTGSELSVRTVAEVAYRGGLPFYADPETVRRCQEKDAMRSAYHRLVFAFRHFEDVRRSKRRESLPRNMAIHLS